MKTEKPTMSWGPLRAILLAMVLGAGMTAGAAGQGLTTGAVSVRVTDAAGGPVTEVLLTLADTTDGVTYSATADRLGRFRFGAVAPGDYTLTVERIGFSPRQLVGVSVRPERELSVVIGLSRAGDSRVELERNRLGVGVAPVGARQWLPNSVWRPNPGRGHDVNGLTRLSSVVADGFTVEGLPGTLSTLAIDGTSFRSVSHPSMPNAPVLNSVFSQSGLDAAQVITNAVDVEWSGAAAGVLSLYTRRGSTNGGGVVAGSFSGDALSVSSMNGGTVPFTDIQGGIALEGGMSGENGRFSLGVAGRSTGTPQSQAWSDTDAAAAAIALDPDLAVYGASIKTTEDVIAGFAHIDWTTESGHTIEAGVHAAGLPSFSVIDPRSGALIGMQGGDYVTNLALRSLIGVRARNEVRMSFTGGTRSAAPDNAIEPFTRVVNEGLAFGSSPWIASTRDARLQIGDVLHYRNISHTVKVGGTVALGVFEYDPVDSRAGEYLYGSIDELAAGNGVLARAEGNPPIADWTDRTFAVFVQDRYLIRDGAELVAGVRVERQMVQADVRRDHEWFALTGISNSDFDQPAMRVSPRVALNWDVAQNQRYFLNAAAGIYYDRLDPVVLASWMTDDGTSVVRRVVGPLAFPPASQPGGETRRRLTVMSPEFDAPRTMRVSGGFASRVTDGTTVHFGGVVRRTEKLPRRTDLNLLQVPVSRDQHGRAVYGTLRQQGGLLAAMPGSNRRFESYDEVAALTADGTSSHWSVTAGIEHAVGGAFSMVARYTYGRTRDNWFAAALGGWTDVMPMGIPDANWIDATSDLDVPHRAAAGVVMTGPIGLRLGAVYRFQSGSPFTPGFSPGVDANADGNSTNDPAFVDTSIPGIAEIVARESCLGGFANTFVDRNACRGAAIHALDMSLRVPLFGAAGGDAAIVVDAYDVLESRRDLPNTALYLVDPAGSIIEDTVDRRVTLPLVANPQFGEPLTRRMPGRTIRVGLSFNW